MTNSVLLLGLVLIVAWYWIRDPQATYSMRLRRAFIMACFVALIVGTFF